MPQPNLLDFDHLHLYVEVVLAVMLPLFGASLRSGKRFIKAIIHAENAPILRSVAEVERSIIDHATEDDRRFEQINDGLHELSAKRDQQHRDNVTQITRIQKDMAGMRAQLEALNSFFQNWQRSKL